MFIPPSLGGISPKRISKRSGLELRDVYSTVNAPFSPEYPKVKVIGIYTLDGTALVAARQFMLQSQLTDPTEWNQLQHNQICYALVKRLLSSTGKYALYLISM